MPNEPHNEPLAHMGEYRSLTPGMEAFGQRLAAAALLAVKLERETLALGQTPVPAEVILPQWAVESAWGADPCGQNYFGIKKSERDNLSIMKTTHETVTRAWFDAYNLANPQRPAQITVVNPDGTLDVVVGQFFADYPDLEASMRDYCWLIANGEPYSGPWADYLLHHDCEALLAGIAAHYATSEAYRKLVTSIARQENIRLAIAVARETAST